MNVNERDFMEIYLKFGCQLKKDEGLLNVEMGINPWWAKDYCVIDVLKMSEPYTPLDISTPTLPQS